jgi:hypothetical protein
VITPREQPRFEKPQLMIVQTTYKIIHWSNDTISALYEAPVADVQLKISLGDKFVERHSRETKARGSKGADSKIYHALILE